MVTKIAFLGIILFGVGPLGARIGVVPSMVGFGLFALGGLLGIVALLWGGVSALQGNASWLAPVLGLAVTGTFLAVALPGRAYPPYNDFTTDTEDPPAFVHAGKLPANHGRDLSYPGGAVTAAQRRAYPDLRPLELPAPREEAFRSAVETAARMLDWEITLQDPDAGIIEGVATTSLFQFKDDFVIRIRARDGGSRIDMRSKSRDGKGDIGVNANRIRAFFTAMRTDR